MEEHCDSEPAHRARVEILILEATKKLAAKASEMGKGIAEAIPFSTAARSTILQLLFAFIASTPGISPGMMLGYSAVALPKLQSNGSTIAVGDTEASWIASIASIATPIGCLLIGSLMDRFGRKLALLSINIPLIVGWLLIALAQNLPMIYAGRLLTGLGTGMCSTPGPVYVGEAAQPHLRGMLVCWNSIAMALGILIVYVLGYYLDWRMVAAISIVFPVVSFFSVLTVPESPVWLLNKKRQSEARVSLERLRGGSGPAKNEFQEMIAEQEQGANKDENRGSMLSAFLQPQCYKPFIIMNGFFFFQQFSGIFVILFYAVNIVREAGIDADEFFVTVLIGVTQFVFILLVSFVLRTHGRRPATIISGVGMFLGMAILGTYLLLKKMDVFAEDFSLSWIPLLALILYIITCTVGFYTLPWAMIGEVYPSQVRGIASGATTCFAYLFSFVILKIYPQMLNCLEPFGLFYFYAAVSLLGTLFIVFFLPETNGKSLQEIEQYFSSKSVKTHKVSSV